MEYITLNNGVKMPTEGIGTFLLTPDEAESAVVSALHSGATLIDTANAYVNEKAVGRAMKASGLQREEIFLETKLWPSFYKDADAVDKTPTKRGKSAPSVCPTLTSSRWKRSSLSARCSPRFCRPKSTPTTKSRNSRRS